MRCPVCNEVDLLMTERQGIEIDYCPRCRGVWLDRGELDRLIERAAGEERGKPSPRSETPSTAARGRGERYPDDEHYRRRRKSWLREIFDFD